MKVDIKNLEKSQKEIIVEIPSEKVVEYYDKAIGKISLNLKIKGFRPGKIPADVVKKTIGEHAIFEEAAEDAVRETFIKVIEDNKIQAIGQPNIQITKLSLGNPVEFKAIVSVMPEISLGQYKGLKPFKKDIEVKEQEIDAVLKNLQKTKTQFVSSNEGAKDGDKLDIDFSAFADGSLIENGEAKKHILILGSNQFLPDFEKQMIGAKTGEEKEFTIKMPAEYHKESLREKEVSFKVKVNSVQTGNIPDLSDEFVKSLGYKINTVADLKKDIKDHLSKQKETAENEKSRIFLIEQVVGESKMDIPQILIDSELSRVLEEYKSRIEQMGVNFKSYLEQNKKSEDDVKKDLSKEAENRVKINLVLREIAKKEDIKADQNDINREFDTLVQMYPEAKTKNKEDVIYYIENSLKNEKVFDFLEKNTK